jgi:hypothetical protein
MRASAMARPILPLLSSNGWIQNTDAQSRKERVLSLSAGLIWRSLINQLIKMPVLRGNNQFSHGRSSG